MKSEMEISSWFYYFVAYYSNSFFPTQEVLFTMAVPKRKKSKSRRNMRRGSNGSYSVNLPNVVVDATTGEYKLSHHISVDGHYNGRKVVELSKKVSEVAEAS